MRCDARVTECGDLAVATSRRGRRARRKMDARDDEIARLRAALRRATEAAMAYADTSSKRIDELKTQMRRRAETDATTIEELRDALEKARARNDEDDDEPRAAAPSGETTSDDAERASRRNELLESFLRGAREDVGRARETLARRARVRADV